MQQYLVMLVEEHLVDEKIVFSARASKSFKKMEDALNFAVDSVKQITTDETIIEFVSSELSLDSNSFLSFDTEDERFLNLSVLEIEVE